MLAAEFEATESEAGQGIRRAADDHCCDGEEERIPHRASEATFKKVVVGFHREIQREERAPGEGIGVFEDLVIR